MKDGRRKDGCGLSGEALELSLEEVGARLKKPRQRILEFERAEAQDRITLKSLRRVAAALDCNLVYALVPRTDSILELAQQRVRQDATRDVVDVVPHGARGPGTRQCLAANRLGNTPTIQEAMSTIPDLNATPGNTPLHPDDAGQLIPNLATRRELDERSGKIFWRPGPGPLARE
jgi:transcriptional regulator with XRE-family HTH domain